MGKATITQNLGEGQYAVRLHLNEGLVASAQAALDRLIAQRQRQVEALQGELEKLQAETAKAQQAVGALAQQAADWGGEYRAKKAALEAKLQAAGQGVADKQAAAADADYALSLAKANLQALEAEKKRIEALPPTGTAVINAMRAKCSITGAVSPFAVSNFQDVSLYQMLAALFDVGAFNELFVDDREDGIDLVLRPAPFWDVNGAQIQGAKPEAIEIASADIESFQVSRSDESVANYFWVNSDQAVPKLLSEREIAMFGSNLDDWLTVNYINTDQDYYGFRKMEVGSKLAPPGLAYSDAPTAGQAASDQAALGGWLASRRKLLADLNKDALVFESGRIALRGNEKVRHGMALAVRRGAGNQLAGQYYAHSVTHEFQPFSGQYRTVATVERGTGWVSRASPGEPKYWGEADAGGSLPGAGNA